MPRAIIFFIAAAALSFASARGEEEEETNFAPPAVLEMIRTSGIPPHRIGVVARLAKNGEAAVSVNASRAFNPASAIKLITAFAALDMLGPDYRWKTTIARGGKLSADGTLQGDLYLKGGGDPYITVERFWGMLSELRERGIRKISGALVIDDSFFQPPPHDPGAFDGAGLRPYNVGAGAMAVNFRASEILLAPSASGGVTVRQTPPSDGLRLENRLRLDTRRCGNYRGRVRERWSEESINGGDAARAVLTLSGSYSRRCGERGWRLAAPLSHPRYVAGVFAAMWRRLGGEFGGEWRVGKTPPNAPHIAEFESPPLADILRGMNKFSNNFMARQIFLSLPAAAGGEPPHTIAAARAAVHSWLQTRKLIADGKSASDSESFFIDNGSGLSRRARMTPDLMAAALANAWAHPWRAEFLASLPLAGLDGTMKKRFRNGDLAGRARFKTGSLNNVKALAGVVRDAAGRDWIVVCFVNWRGAWKAKRFQDNFLRWLFQNGAALGGV